MRKILIALGLLIILLIVGIIALPSLIPSSVYKDKIQTQLSTKLERDVTISGDVKLSVFPILAAQTGRVDIANPEGFGDGQFASMDGMKAKVRLLPLFSKQVEISAFILDAPTINLIKAKNGTTNWAMGETKPKAETDAGPFKRDGRFAELDPKIGLFEINDGTVTYDDRVTNKKYTAEDMNMGFSLPSLSDPIAIDGSLIFNGEPAKLDLRLDTPRAFLDGQETPLSLALKTDFADIKAKGAFAASQEMAADMNMDVDISDVSALVDLIPADIPYADLANTVKLSGDYNFDGKILRAKNASIAAQGESFTGRFDGNATLSETPVLDGKIDADVSNVQALLTALGQDVKGADLIQTASLSADFASQNEGFSAQNIKAAAQGDGLRANYAGTGAFNKDLSLVGNFDVQADDPSAIVAALDMDIPETALIGVTNITGDVNFKNKITTLNNLTASTTSDMIEGGYKGSVIAGEDVSAKGDFDVKIFDPSTIASTLKMDIPEATLLGLTQATGSVKFENKTAHLSNLITSTKSDVIEGNYKGSVIAGENVSANGDFEVKIFNPSAITSTLKMDIPEATLLGVTQAAGAVTFENKTARISNLIASTQSELINGDYKGSIATGETLALNGDFTANVSQLPEISRRIGKDIPYAASIGNVSANGRLDTTGQILNVSNLTATLTNGQINGRFDGTARTDISGKNNDALTLNGNLKADIPSIRAIAQTQNVTLPPNSKDGNIYEAFNIEGAVTGSPTKLTFNNANISLDDIKGTGNFAANMSGAKPYVTGRLDLEGLNLKPYMSAYAAQKETGAIEPWSEERIEMTAMRTVDGKFDITTPFVKTGRMDLGQTTINATLSGGKLTANMPELAMYGGVGSLNAAFDASSSIPQISMDVDLSSLQSSSFLGAIAGFTNAMGEGGTTLSIRGSGISQAAIMKSLAGQGDFKLQNGQISGVDVSQFVSGIEQTLTSRTLPSGIGPTHITKFQDLGGLFTIDNGVAQISRFVLSGNGISAEGQGEINLGHQTIDFSLHPKLVGDNVSGLAAFGIPIRYSGKFGSASASLDTKFLGKIVEDRARARAAQEVTSVLTDRLGGNNGSAIGSIVGGIIGGNSQTGASPPPSSSSTNDNFGTVITSPSIPTRAPAPTTEDVVGGLLGGLLGSGSSNTAQSGQTDTTTQQQEPTLEDALGGLFGKKKKNK